MKYDVAETARILETDTQQLKAWAYQFRDNLSTSANPKKGASPSFTTQDVLVLLYVSHFWEDDPDIEAIVVGLNSEDHLEDTYVHVLWNRTPLLQNDVPEHLDEPSRYGLLVTPHIHLKRIEVARSYHHAANVLWDKANDSGFPLLECYPVLFSYRHALELYLKILGDIGKGHSLKSCMDAVEKHLKKKIRHPMKEWIMTLHRMDETGWSFRYEPETEGTMDDGQWLDWSRFRYAMDTLFRELDFAWLKMAETIDSAELAVK